MNPVESVLCEEPTLLHTITPPLPPFLASPPKLSPSSGTRGSSTIIHPSVCPGCGERVLGIGAAFAARPRALLPWYASPHLRKRSSPHGFADELPRECPHFTDGSAKSTRRSSLMWWRRRQRYGPCTGAGASRRAAALLSRLLLCCTIRYDCDTYANAR